MKKIYIQKIAILSLLCAFTACNDYLDQMPDNRAEIDTEEKVAKLLVSAYPTNGYVLACELASDNVDDQGHANPYYDRFGEQLYRWSDVTETNNESPKRVWEACYGAIACANQALSAMEEMTMTPNLAAAKGEALISRAYAHFILVNMFCHNYDERYSESDLGIPYMTAAETELNPKYDRGTVADVYRLIEKDVEEGLPLINDAFYTVPKYHMNQKAAYTFASRFYLFYKKFDKVISCANVALGAQPSQLLRDYVTLASYPRDLTVVSTAYSGTAMKSNFLVQTAYSSLGVIFGAYYTGSRFNHGSIMAAKETYNYAPWGVYDISTNNFQYFYKLRPYIYSGTNLNKVLIPRSPYIFEYSDPVAGTGYSRAVYVALSAEEALLNRAEAYVLQNNLSNALLDINLWTSNTLNAQYTVGSTTELTTESINGWANGMEYYDPMIPTPKKKLNAGVDGISNDQENMIHCLLYMRRFEFLHLGLRWFDVKRYGIEIYRRTVGALNVESVDDKLEIRDERRAMQLPDDVITAGMTPNPRKK